MDAPQSGDDVRLVVEEMQVLDPQLDVRWNNRARVTKRGGYDAEGKIINPEYQGLWEIIHYDTSVKTANWRPYTRICFVTTQVRVAADLLAMPQDGEYAPLGMWVVEFLKQADKHNQEEARRLQARLDRMNEAADERAMRGDDGALEEAAGRQYFEGTKAGGGVSEFHPVRVNLTR